MPHIKLENVSLNYPVYGVDNRSLKNNILKFVSKNKLTKNSNRTIIVEALKKINLDLNCGDRLGLIGHNGAGKTTLLKVIAQIYTPTAGKINIKGKTNCLFDIMMGMDPESTGYENIKLRGIILGLPTRKIKQIIPDIENFAELSEFMNMPIKTYSSGMLIRLAFGIITSVAPEILLIDEVFNVGDVKFMKKSKQRMSSLIHQASIMVLSTHDINIINEFCNKVLWLEQGEVKLFGACNKVLKLYNKEYS